MICCTLAMNNNEQICGVFLFLISTLPSAAVPCLITELLESPTWSNAPNKMGKETPVSSLGVDLENVHFFFSPPRQFFAFLVLGVVLFCFFPLPLELKCLKASWLGFLFCFCIENTIDMHEAVLVCSSLNYLFAVPSPELRGFWSVQGQRWTLCYWGQRWDRSWPYDLHLTKRC